MTQPYLGEIRMFSYNFATKGWAFAAGQLVSIQQNQALFSLLGTTYGGNGITTFALPDLRGRTPIHWGTGLGLPTVVWGERAGEENHTLSTLEMPQHNHMLQATTLEGTKKTVANAVMGNDDDTQVVDYYAAANAQGSSYVTMNAGAISPAGSNAAHNNMQPYAVTNMCIALSGVFPSRN